MFIKRLNMRPRGLVAGAFLALSLMAGAGINLTTNADTKLSEVISAIKSQSDYQFFYDDAMASQKVKAVSLKDADIKAALDRIFAGTGISYTVKDNIVYLKHTPAKPEKKDEAARKSRTVKGQLLDENGDPLIGASVMIKGSNTGVATDIDGNYSIEVSDEHPVLNVSYVGYKPREIKVNSEEMAPVALEPDSQALSEVVVTALGIKREKKMLGYSVQDVKAGDLNTTGDPSVVSALSGKVAGLQMNTAGTGLSGSTKITIRGNSSLSDNNQPLWIVDGVPFTDNNTSNASAYGGYDRGGTAFDINPEDIESISVLKGPNAAALYGSRAGNGVILVTTKRGTGKQGFGFSYSGSFTWSEVFDTMKQQTLFGQGNSGKYTYQLDADGQPTKISENVAFGPRLDGHEYTDWTGSRSPYSYFGNKIQDYFQTGFAQFHTFILSHSKDGSHYRLSVGYNDNDGMFRDETLRKLNIDLSAGTTFNKWMTSEAKVSVSNTKAENRPYTGNVSEMAQLMQIPGNISLASLRNYSSDKTPHLNWAGPDEFFSNPYYIRHRYKNSDERWRAFGFYSINLDISPWAKVIAKYAFDYYRTRIQETDLSLGKVQSTGSSSWQDQMEEDNMTRQELNHFEQNISLNVIGDKTLNDTWRVGYTAGGNIMYQKNETFGASMADMLIKDKWIFNSGHKLTAATDNTVNRAMYSLYASAQVAYNEYLSLDLTARNDWSSTLPTRNNSFFYPSANLSFVFTDFIRKMNGPLPTAITFGKLRLSAAQVGKDPDPYKLYNEWIFNRENGSLSTTLDTQKKNSNLKPEIATSYEAGLDMKFFNNRLGFDFTYYHTQTKNQAMLVSAAAPWSQQWVNAGKITNQGFELMLYGRPVDTNDLTVNISANLAHNRTTVDELATGVNHIYFAPQNGDTRHMPINVGAVPGGKLGDIYAKTLMKRDQHGNIVVGPTGLPQPETGNGNEEQYKLDHPIGNIQPDLLMSVTPSLRWKNFNVSAMFDMKFGGDIVSVSEGLATQAGTAERTAFRGEFKEINGIEDYYMVVPGVKADGTPNDIPVSASGYYSAIGLYNAGGYAEEFLYDASYIKLKELSVGYSLPSKWLRKTPVRSARLSFVARNLCYLMKHTPGNPEGGYDISMFSQALDYFSVPNSRTYGFTVNLEF